MAPQPQMRTIPWPSGFQPEALLDGIDEDDIQNIVTKAKQLCLTVAITLPIICFALVALVAGWYTDFILRRRQRSQAAANHRF